MIRKKKKRELHVNLTGGIKNLEDHFTSMAEKGWLIEKIGMFFRSYKAVEPQKIRFCVDVLPEIGIFDYPDSENAKVYRSLCEDAGWSFVTSQKNIHVFRAESTENEPLNLHTDNQVQNTAYMNAYKKSEFYPSIFSFLVCMLSMVMCAYAVFNVNIRIPYTIVFLLPGMIGPTLVALFHLIIGVVWYQQAKYAHKHSLPLPVINKWIYHFNKNINFFGITVLYVCIILGIIFEAQRGTMPMVFMVSGVIMGIILLFIWDVLWQQVKNKKRSKVGNIILVVIGFALAYAVLLGVIIVLVILFVCRC